MAAVAGRAQATATVIIYVVYITPAVTVMVLTVPWAPMCGVNLYPMWVWCLWVWMWYMKIQPVAYPYPPLPSTEG